MIISPPFFFSPFFLRIIREVLKWQQNASTGEKTFQLTCWQLLTGMLVSCFSLYIYIDINQKGIETQEDTYIHTYIHTYMHTYILHLLDCSL